MSYNKFTKEETLVWKFLKEDNMSCDPSKWKDGYKDFIRHCKIKISYDEFEEILLNFRNYYSCIFYEYDNNEFGKFKFNKHFTPNFE